MKKKLLSLLFIGSMALSMATPLAAAAQEAEDALSLPTTVSQDSVSVAEEPLSSPTTASQDTVSVEEASSQQELSQEEISQMQQDFLNQEVTESVIIDDTLSPPAEISLSPSSTDSTNNATSSYIYLSDLEHDDALSNLQWNLFKNATPSGEGVQITKDGTAWTYAHGLGFSTNNNGTVAELTYNIAEYAADYPSFHAYLGVDTRQTGKGDGAIIQVYTSTDGIVWEPVQDPVLHTAGSDAIEITVDISQASYIKFRCDKNQNNSYDHVAIADPRLMVSGYDLQSEIDPPLLTTQEYDALISQRTVEENYTSSSNLHQVLLRELVDRLGYDAIISATTPCMYEYTEGTREALEWFKQDMDALQLFIEAGEYFSGNSKKALVALGRLYSAHAADMNNPVYRKMLLATAAAYSKVIKSYTTNYGGNAVMSDPVVKYERFKELYNRGDFVYPEQFAAYPMELVRAVMDCKIDDDEIFWLSDKIDATYPNTSNTARLNGYSFIAYKSASYGINAKPEFYNEENYDTWNEKYKLEQYGISYGEPNLYRMWMFMEAGGVCWAVSNTGMVMAEVQGIPAINTYQPQHEAYLLYQIDSNGNGIWKLWNDVFGWQSSYTRWGSSAGFTEARLIFEWGQMDFNTLSGGNNTTYILLATDALNHYADYQQSMLYQLIANCYPQTSDEHIEALNTSLTHYDKNLDSIYALIKAYRVRENTTQEEWANLAKMVIDRYTFFPAPMVDVLKLITPHLTNGMYLAEINVLKIAALNRAANATGADTPQDTACRNVAKSLLNNSTVPLATFSFDGENKNTIVLDSSYDDSEFAVRVSLDGEQSWLQFTEDGQVLDYTYSHAITLTQDQIDQITADNDIIIGIVGTDTTYTIDIKAGNTIQDSAVYKNDNENLLLGSTDHMEYSYDGETWYDYEPGLTSSTRFEGAVSVSFRYKSYGTYLTGPVRTYQFYKDDSTDECSYLPLQHISLEDFSSQQGAKNQYATNLIDGNANTVWHTSWNGDNERTYTVALDHVRYITKIGYMSGTDANGRPKNMDIYVSLDGQDWDLIKTANMANHAQPQYIELDAPVACRYIKLHGRETYGNSASEQNKFFAGRMLWLYEDKTQSYAPEATIHYTPATWTNGSVTATLELPAGCHAEVTEHEFTTNGTFDFTYTDANNVVHTVTATVDFIDTTPPTATVAYSTTQWTNGTVTAQLTNISEDVVSIEAQIPEDGDFYFDYNEALHQITFTNNGTFSFILTDRAGNTSQVDMTVKWIDLSKPEDDKILLETTVELPDETGNMQSVDGYTLNVSPDVIEILGITRVSDGQGGAVGAESGYVETENGYVIIQSGTYTYHLRLLSTQYEFDYTVNVEFPDDTDEDDTNNRLAMIVSPESASFTGKAHTPTITVTYNDRELTPDTDYTLSYAKADGTKVDSMVDVGIYTITATGTGNYTGTVTGTYEITSVNTGDGSTSLLTVALAEGVSDTYTYTGSDITPAVTVSFNGVPLTEDDYSVTYASNINAGQGVITVNGQGNNYQGMSGKITFTINRKGIDDDSISVAAIANQTYTGQHITPTVTITDGERKVELRLNEDYEVEYSDNLNVGTATVTITGRGNYSGSTTATFTISAASMGDGSGNPSAGFTVEVRPSASEFTGSAHSPDVVVTHNGMQLKEGTDYTLTYKNAAGTDIGKAGLVEVGSYTITVTGRGNYSGTVDTSYIITPVSGDSTLAIDSIGDQTYTGAAITPVVTVRYNGQVVDGANYDVAYSANTNVGQATVIVTGKTGTSYENMVGTTTFTIGPKDITNSDITVAAIADQTYTGSAIQPGVTISDGTRGTDLIENADYTLSYADNVDVGTATITITGRGNYTGSTTAEFTISAASIGDGSGRPSAGFTVEVRPSAGEFTGSTHSPDVVVTHNGMQLKEGTDYTLTYKDAAGTEVGEAGLVEVGAYTITVTGRGNYIGTVDAAYTITSASGSSTLAIDSIGDQIYTGSAITPVVTVMYNGQVVDGSNYDVAYSGNINVGQATVIVTGKTGTSYENMAGTTTFNITAKSITSSDITVAAIADQTYTGSAIRPGVTITDGARNVKLTLDEDYKVEYSDNLNLGTATVTITGMGNYSGSTTTTFEIVAADVGGGSGGGSGGGATGGGASSGGTTTDPGEEKPDDSADGVASPDQTGVSSWLNTSEHVAYLSGYPGNIFGVDNKMTRAEVAQMFYNLLLNKNVPIATNFDDVPADAWYAKAVNTLASLGIINGTGDNQYDSMRQITRAEFTVIAMRFATLEAAGDNQFPDISSDDWFYDYVVGAVQYGWIQGYPDGSFGPYDTITRGEVTTIVNRMLARSADESYVDSHQDDLVQFTDVPESHWAYYQVMEATNSLVSNKGS